MQGAVSQQDTPGALEKRLDPGRSQASRGPAVPQAQAGCAACGALFHHERWKHLCCAPSLCPCDAGQACAGAGLGTECFCQITPGEPPREKLLVVLYPVASLPAVSRRFPSDLTEDSERLEDGVSLGG